MSARSPRAGGDRVRASARATAPAPPARSRRDPRIDAYIERAAPFARPILRHIRTLVHRGCPAVTETLKWGHPAYEHHGLLAGMAAFRAHCAFMLWKQKLLEARGLVTLREDAMGTFGRIESKADLPPDGEIVKAVRAAALFNEEGVSVPRAKRAPRPVPTAPAAFTAALRKVGALERFKGMSPSMRREYIEWIAEAKREATRDRRIAQAVEWIREGKGRNWEYQRRG